MKKFKINEKILDKKTLRKKFWIKKSLMEKILDKKSLNKINKNNKFIDKNLKKAEINSIIIQ